MSAVFRHDLCLSPGSLANFAYSEINTDPKKGMVINMKVAVIGSRTLAVNDISPYLPEGVSEIVSGGAHGIDLCAAKYAEKENIKLTEFLPEYHKYGRCAPIKRNLQIIEYADEVLAFWDGISRGTKHVIEACKKSKKKITVVKL